MVGRVRDVERDVVPLGQATRAWFRISLQTFGGPVGQIAVMQRELVDAEAPLVPDDALHRARPSAQRNLTILAAGLALWVVPVVAAWALASGSGSRTVFTDQGLVFGGMALGACALLGLVLSYLF
jgi:hypothetical protein